MHELKTMIANRVNRKKSKNCADSIKCTEMWLDGEMRLTSRPQSSIIWPLLWYNKCKNSHLHPQNPQKNHFWAHIIESLWKIHIRIAAWCIEIRCWNLARCFTLPSTLSTHKVSTYGVWQGASSPHIKFWDILFISETNRARKLQFGTLVSI